MSITCELNATTEFAIAANKFKRALSGTLAEYLIARYYYSLERYDNCGRLMIVYFDCGNACDDTHDNIEFSCIIGFDIGEYDHFAVVIHNVDIHNDLLLTLKYDGPTRLFTEMSGDSVILSVDEHNQLIIK